MTRRMSAIMIARKALVVIGMLVLAFVMTAMCGCSQQEQQNSGPSQASAPAETSTEVETAPEGKTLVAFFSGSGNTERVAQMIASDLGADMFVITPKEPYTSDDLNWRNESSRVNAEHEDESLRDVALAQVTPDDLASYDTIFIGYPIWWGIAAWPVDGFVSGNDFSGKTIIPFCTSTSSGLGESAQLLEGISNGGTWLQGERFASNATAEDVANWLASLNLS